MGGNDLDATKAICRINSGCKRREHVQKCDLSLKIGWQANLCRKAVRKNDNRGDCGVEENTHLTFFHRVVP